MIRGRFSLTILLPLLGVSCRTVEEKAPPPELVSATEPIMPEPSPVQPGWVATADYRPPETHLLRFEPPPGWTLESPTDGAHQAVYVLYSAHESIEQAKVIVDYFGPVGRGTDRENLQRWAQWFDPDGTVDLGATAWGSSSSIMGWYPDSQGKRRRWCRTFQDVEFCGTYFGESLSTPGKRIGKDGWCMLATIIDDGRVKYYVRLIGPENEVGRWGSAYRSFVESGTPIR